ncbi:hypothetical protein [Duganella sp. LjRoot269]|uniref:hypothetical protein n=1 Tax=Duganella sp. LjRoot269 TaxID=3342305 RepID=UPI003ECE1F5D
MIWIKIIPIFSSWPSHGVVWESGTLRGIRLAFRTNRAAAVGKTAYNIKHLSAVEEGARDGMGIAKVPDHH